MKYNCNNIDSLYEKVTSYTYFNKKQHKIYDFWDINVSESQKYFPTCN